MRVLALAAALVVPSAHAEWVRIGGSDSVALYFQDATVKSVGVHRSAAFSLEYSSDTQTPQGLYTYRSLKQFADVDCLKREIRIWQTEAYAGPGRTGRVVFISDSPAQLGRPNAGSFAAMMVETLCR